MQSMPESEGVGELNNFFDYLWSGAEGWVYLPYKTKSGEWKKVSFEWPKHKEHIIKHVMAKSAEGHDVYCSPMLFNDARPLRENFKGTNVLWADFDGSVPDGWSTENGESGSVAPVDGETPSPTLRVQSSSDGHEHTYWRLDEFTTDAAFVENTNRALAYTLRADTSGWDLGQVLRPPGTTNYKHDLPVTVIHQSDVLLTRSSFSHLKAVKQLVSEALDLQEIPDVTRVVAKYIFDEQHYELFMAKEQPEGKRSSALMKLGFFGAESGMTDGEIYSLLLNADDRWGKFKNRTDRQRRLLDIINKARQKHPVGISSPEGLLRALNKTDSSIEVAPKYVYGFDEFLHTDVHIEWALEDLLEVGGIGVLASAPGVGKTQMSIQLAISCALGTPFLIWQPVRKMKILILSLEMSHAALKHFIGTIAQQYTETEIEILERNLKIAPLGEPLPMDHPDGRKFLETLLDEYQPDGIIIDSMGKVTNESLSDEKKIKQLNSYYVSLRNRYKCFLWFIHHNRKATGDNKKPTELSDLYGNQYIAAETSCVLNLWKDKSGSLELSTIKNRLAIQPEPFEIERNDNLYFEVKQGIGKFTVKPKEEGEAKDGFNNMGF